MKYLKDSYKFYNGKVKFKTFMEINKLFFKFIIEEVFKGKTIYLPKNLGFFEIRSRKYELKFNKETNKIENTIISWGKTFKLWNENPEAKKQRKLVKIDNLHSENYRGKFVWSHYNVLLKNKNLYHFIITRGNKRRISKDFFENNYHKYKTINHGY